jgi:hypothetical protein
VSGPGNLTCQRPGRPTTRLRLGTYVTAALPESGAAGEDGETLDEVSGGAIRSRRRMERAGVPAFGVPFEHRFDRFEDALRIVTSMLRTAADWPGHAQAGGARLSRAGLAPWVPHGRRGRPRCAHRRAADE